MRFIKEQSGQVTIDGEGLTPQNENAWLRKIAYVPQSPYILDSTIKENIAFGVPTNNIDINKVNNSIRDLGLEAWVAGLDNELNSIIGERGVKISGGQRQRLAIARALYHDAEILLLDEITNQLDSVTELEIMRTLHQLSKSGKTIILISHHHNKSLTFDAVYELSAGRLIEIENLNKVEN